jgi:hypothetical protein
MTPDVTTLSRLTRVSDVSATADYRSPSISASWGRPRGSARRPARARVTRPAAAPSWIGCPVILAALFLAPATALRAAELQAAFNPSHPVVVTGADVQGLLGTVPARIVGFVRRSDTWVQVPVQVDQMVLASKGQMGGNPGVPLKARWKNHYLYADSKNAAGPGAATLSEHDEIAMLYEDFSAAADPAGPDPPGVVPKTRMGIQAGSERQPPRWLYLFQSNGELKPDAGRKPVNYRFHSLIAPDDVKRWEQFTPEISSYRFIPHRKENKVQYELPPLPSEDSSVEGENYRLVFDARNRLSDLEMLMPGAATTNIVEHDKFYYGSEMRQQAYLVSVGNRILADVAGPVRAIRVRQLEWSASLGYDVWTFYPRMVEYARHWIIHPGPALWFGLNLSEDAAGMQYFDNLNEQGVVIDGQPDQVKTGPLKWQLTTGKPGSLLIQHTLDTNIENLPVSSRYYDVKDPFYFTRNATFPDTGAFAFGANGPLYGPYPQTVPKGEPGNYMVVRRRFLFGPPGVSLEQVRAAVELALPTVEVDQRRNARE